MAKYYYDGQPFHLHFATNDRNDYNTEFTSDPNWSSPLRRTLVPSPTTWVRKKTDCKKSPKQAAREAGYKPQKSMCCAKPTRSHVPRHTKKQANHKIASP